MYVISYDISNDRARSKIADEIENYGRRVQYSVFECEISDEQLKKLYSRLALLIPDNEEGNIRIYKLCGKCEQDIMTMGTPNNTCLLKEAELYII